MRTKRLKMAAKLIALVAIMVCGFLFSNSYAAQDPAASALLYTYYDVRSMADGGLGLTDNYFTVTNTSASWVQAHVRIRTGDKSVELLDFDVLLSPKDVFAFDLYLASNGGIEFASCDTKTLQNSGFTLNVADKCVVINSVSRPDMLSLIKKCQGVDDAAALAKTLKGYVEIIGEGMINPDPGDKTKCYSWTSGANQNIPGRTLYNITASPNLCVPDDLFGMEPVLEGRVYYVAVDSNYTVQRLGYLNAEALDTELPEWGLDPTPTKHIILHADSYGAEQARCLAGDSGCFAYVDAAIAVTNGAGDLNMCFYKNKITSANDVVNRFGAAATFGPTLADLLDRRDGSVSTTNDILDTLSGNFSQLDQNSNMFIGAGGASTIDKNFADSHYFAVPSPTYSLDMNTRFAFIFPFQHFTNEADSISGVAYDTEENTISIPLEKYISPGLPTLAAPGEEAGLFTFSAPYPEGWVSFSPLASNATCGADSDGTDDVRCDESVTDTYLPGYTGAVFTVGNTALGASHFYFRED